MPHGERRGRVYTASSTLNDAASKIKAEEPSQIPDPFASLARRGLAKEQTKEPKEPEKLVTKEQFAQLRKEIGKIGRKIP